MTAPIAVTYPPANLLFFCDHPWPVPAPCEPGIWVPCAGCGTKYAPCTRSALDLAAVTDRTWRCMACSQEAV
jgi:hypothetical protein